MMTVTDRTHRSDRGVSDVVAFVLTFSIIIAGVGIVSTGGFDRLTEFTNEQQIDNSERGMEAAASTIDNLHRNSDTYREFDLSLNGGNIRFRESDITVNSSAVDLSKAFSDSDEAQINVNALEHRLDFGDETVNIAYEGSGVFRTDTSRVQYRPGLRVDGNTAIVSLVKLMTDESIDRSGGTGSSVQLEPTGVPDESPVSVDNQFISFSAELVDTKRVYETDSTGLDIGIDVSETVHPDQWEYFFEQADNWSGSGDIYTPEGNVNTVLVRVSTIELSVLPRRSL